MVNKTKYFFLIIISASIILSGSLSSAEEFGYGKTEEIPINYSNIVINETANTSLDSERLEGRDTSQLYTYFKSLFDNVYCKLTGCTMEGDINMGGNDITNAGSVTADYFIGDGSQLTGIDSTDDNTYYEYLTNSRFNTVIENLSDSDQTTVREYVQAGSHYVYGEYLV